MNRSVLVLICEIMAIVTSLIGAYLAFGAAAALFVAAAWCLVFARVLTRSKRPLAR